MERRITRVKINSNILSFGLLPKAGTEMEQHLTIHENGRLWLYRYVIKEDLDFTLKSGDSNYTASIEKRIARVILDYIQKYLESNHDEIFVTDIGDWEMTVFWSDGDKSYRRGSLCGLEIDNINLSVFIRESLGFSDLFLFDGGDSDEEKEEEAPVK